MEKGRVTEVSALEGHSQFAGQFLTGGLLLQRTHYKTAARKPPSLEQTPANNQEGCVCMCV